MKTLNSRFWKMLGKYYALPVLLYASVLLLCVVFNHSSWLSRIAFTHYIPGLIILVFVILMWKSHSQVFSRWSINFYKRFYEERNMPNHYKTAVHTWASVALSAVLGSSMYGVYHFIVDNENGVQHATYVFLVSIPFFLIFLFVIYRLSINEDNKRVWTEGMQERGK